MQDAPSSTVRRDVGARHSCVAILEHMSDATSRAEAAAGVAAPAEPAGAWISVPAAAARSAVALLHHAVALVLDEAPVDLPGPEALSRLQLMLTSAEQLKAAQLLAVRDMDSRG